MQNGHSRSFKVTCFGVSGKAIRDYVILNTNVRLIFTVPRCRAYERSAVLRIPNILWVYNTTFTDQELTGSVKARKLWFWSCVKTTGLTEVEKSRGYVGRITSLGWQD